MAELRRLGSTTYLLPGSPATLLKLVEETGRVTVVDPGSERERAKAIAEAVERIGGRPGPIALTHGHSDHVVAAQSLGWRPVYAPRHCVAFVESFWARRLLAYGGRVSERHVAYPPSEVRVDYWVADGNPLPGLRAVALPGHTPGHTGYIAVDDGVLYAGDAVFGEKVLERFGLPFAYDLREFARSLERIARYVDEGYKLVPSHGPVAEGGRARSMIEANARRIEEARELVLTLLGEKPMTVDELAYRVTVELTGREPSVREVMLNRLPVTSLLAWLEEEDRVSPALSGSGVVWRLK